MVNVTYVTGADLVIVLRGKVWQKKLSSLQVAQFPWDPQPTPTPTAATPTVPSNGLVARGQSQQQSSAPTPNGNNNADGVRIKAEPGSEVKPSITDVPPSLPTNHPAVNPTLSNTPAAAQRAAALMQQKFGSQANNSIGTLQQGLKANAQAVTGQSQSNQQQAQQPQRRNSTNHTQTDGADEWTLVSRRRGGDESGRLRADGIIRRHVEEMGLQMEGGGLLLPLSEHRDQETITATSARVSALPLRLARSSRSRTVGYDGMDDMEDGRRLIKSEDEMDDKDAINSDLDDPDDDLDDNPDDDDSNSQIMLCMYDKVTRTKNKWKCILKDGVLTVGGKEFVS